jgi:glutaminase
MSDGVIASYIPELFKANPNWFGICVATVDGQIYEAGDARQPFTIQSVSKPFVYGMALEDRGRAAVLEKIGVEPTGDAFNSISLAPGTGCPLNPMINAGAIAAASLVAGECAEERTARLLAAFSRYAGRPLGLDYAVYRSESETGHRNRAIGHMLRNFDVVSGDPEGALQLYFQQCSISVTCRDLSVMAATLANGGVNPLTGERAVSGDYIDNILSVMTTCGMYDFAGGWVYQVGMPAKSGVSGGVLAVLPGQLGIGIFSPPLDARGNSVRGVRVCMDLSRDLNLHFLRVPQASLSPIRSQYDVATVASKRRRTERERALLNQVGSHARIYELQGELAFSAVESTVRSVVDSSAAHDLVVLELKRVSRVEDAVVWILLRLRDELCAHGKQLVFAYAQRHPNLLAALAGQEKPVPAVAAAHGAAPAHGNGSIPWVADCPDWFSDIDLALEWCEGQLLASHQAGVNPLELLPLAEHQLCQGLTGPDVTYLSSLLTHRRFAARDLIIHAGDEADAFYFLVRGEVSITVELPGGQVKRLATLSPGMAFGEVAVVDRGARSADVRADTEVECYALALADFDRLDQMHATLKTALLKNMLRTVTHTVRRLSQEVAALAQ